MWMEFFETDSCFSLVMLCTYKDDQYNFHALIFKYKTRVSIAKSDVCERAGQPLNLMS